MADGWKRGASGALNARTAKLPVCEFDPVPWHKREPEDEEEARIFQRNRDYEMERAQGFLTREYAGVRPGSQDAWDQECNFMIVMKNIPRQLHSMHRTARQVALDGGPKLNGSKWDALLAGMCERVARSHGHEVPAWCRQDACYLDKPWIMANHARRRQAVTIGTPGSFFTRNVFPPPEYLDYRIGEKRAWCSGAWILGDDGRPLPY